MFYFVIIFGVILLYNILRSSEDNAEQIRELRIELFQPKPQTYRDYMCEDFEPKIRTLVDAVREHSRICKIPGCAGLHRSHV